MNPRDLHLGAATATTAGGADAPADLLEVVAPDPDAAFDDALDVAAPDADAPEVGAPDVGVADDDVPGFWEPAAEPVSLMDMGCPPLRLNREETIALDASQDAMQRGPGRWPRA